MRATCLNASLTLLVHRLHIEGVDVDAIPDVTTAAGFVCYHAGEIPAAGDHVFVSQSAVLSPKWLIVSGRQLRLRDSRCRRTRARQRIGCKFWSNQRFHRPRILSLGPPARDADALVANSPYRAVEKAILKKELGGTAWPVNTMACRAAVACPRGSSTHGFEVSRCCTHGARTSSRWQGKPAGNFAKETKLS